MRARVTRCFSFEAAHHLPWHPGRCRRLHGHHYRLEVTVEGPLGDHGVVMDFDDLSTVVEREVVEPWDHQLLNDLIENPTAELLAQEAWKRLEAAGLNVVGLRLWETPDSAVELTPG
ncbi:MAG: 6-carboxytetrahydropterin synthase QueD [Actinobacteria bacterium]|jgi:6-pyruvoyltetrahydropterin/6-carboxytetrahydropterin synthase|nr:MAG: 6-carboxytetrahydropterin synthase QueD [Actinomycetota bacterium]